MRWSGTARAGLAALFVCNLYEAVVDVPRLLLDAAPDRRPGLLTAGSPLRFYAPLAPFAIGATAATVVETARTDGPRSAAPAGAGLAVLVAATAYVVGAASTTLLVPDGTPTAAERRRLLRSWHRGNAVRLAAIAATVAALPPVSAQLPSARAAAP